MNTIKYLLAIFFSITVAACGGGGGGGGGSPATYSVTGTVTLSGAALSGVTITLTGGKTATTDASGNYSVTGLANGNYTVTPTLAGYAFNPTSSAVSVSGANVTGTDFTATVAATTYSIAGTVSGATGVTITLSGDNTGSVVTGAGGAYTISGLLPGSYTVTPSLTGFTFVPTDKAVTIVAANSTANDFVATAIPVPHSISGKVSGDTSSGVTITVTGTATATATTDASGNYSVSGLFDGDYTVTPSKTGYTFTPSGSAVTMSGANVTGKNFTATANAAPTYAISGAVSGAVLSGVTITLSGDGSATTTTNSSGNYSFSGRVDGNYTVTPSLAGYSFTPTSLAANVSGAAVTGKDFVATAVPVAFSQADLEGQWRVVMLRAGTDSGWIRATGTADSAGDITVNSFLDSSGATTVPAAKSFRWTIDGSGVISESGVNGGELTQMTMTSNKNFIAGTEGHSGDERQIQIAQKVVPGTTYSNADLQNKTFVIHGLTVSATNSGWNYQHGSTNASGMASLSDDWSPSGNAGGEANVGTFSVDASGTVSIDTFPEFKGFLSADKKTIVAVVTEGGGPPDYYDLMIFQITGQTYTAGAMPAGTWAAHMLGIGDAPAPFWAHFTSTVAGGGVISFSEWVSDPAAFTEPASTTGSITASGTLTVAGLPTFHGQMSDDGKFTVGTMTNGAGIYSLQITTK
ncbi:MAG: carboxypeptidase regulatory-like domain-containing protein [Georgfuchsia sp.]